MDLSDLNKLAWKMTMLAITVESSHQDPRRKKIKPITMKKIREIASLVNKGGNWIDAARNIAASYQGERRAQLSEFVSNLEIECSSLTANEAKELFRYLLWNVSSLSNYEGGIEIDKIKKCLEAEGISDIILYIKEKLRESPGASGGASSGRHIKVRNRTSRRY